MRPTGDRLRGRSQSGSIGTARRSSSQPARAQKLIALRAKPEVAISIDEHVLPYKIFYLRGVASIELLDNVPPEYAAAAERYLGLEQGRAYVDRLRGQRFARIRVPPTWANVIDFETRFPSALAD
jgi:hypothetical protein